MRRPDDVLLWHVAGQRYVSLKKVYEGWWKVVAKKQ